MRAVRRNWLRGLVPLSLLVLIVPLVGGTAAAQVVGSSTIDGGADWEYSVEASSPNGGILVHRSLGETYFMYLEEDLSALATPDNAALLDEVTLPRFREAFGVTDMPLVAQGPLVTSLWRLYEVASTDGDLLVLFVVDVTEIPGAGAVEILIAPKPAFGGGLASASANITVNGYPALIAAVPSTAILNAAGLPSSSTSTTQPPAAVPTPTVASAPVPTPAPGQGDATQATGGPAGDYWAQDSPAGCDAIGWVIVDSKQRPVSQADLDARSSCVGGATYAASCGTYLDTGAGVHCIVNVAIGSSPLAVTSGQFTLVDAAGARYPVDVDMTVMHVMLLGGPELPETTVQANSTASGTVIFNPPSTAPTPWVIAVAPAAAGEASGVLVIDGPLQPFSVVMQ